MRRSRGVSRGRGWSRGLIVIVVFALLLEAVLALALFRGEVAIGEPPAAMAAASPPGIDDPPREVPPRVERGSRPRVRLELPRIALWPAPAKPAASAPSSASPAQPEAAGPSLAVFIDDYLARKNSPMMGLGREFRERGRQHNVDPRLLVAIAGNETGYGRILTSRFNAFNWFYRGTWDSHFDSWAQAIEVVTRGIRLYYLDEGRTTVASLGEKYGPIGAENDPLNLNVNFVPNVTALLRELGGDPEHLSFE